ncbi:coiled-coil domain-containing protein 24 isoform X3 [Dunckerocampus dactyliophorus]|uniref:coiled-coil domain-containing protein 24 isoform X3 n=1 Tax=Dunckerocampus dactyliophorus TaxID=161453 RepID=UPI0024072B60|nr:coiled-coil domain-containing protein 24 isoform X3 [Dunckerocampus dactyliophorus]
MLPLASQVLSSCCCCFCCCWPPTEKPKAALVQKTTAKKRSNIAMTATHMQSTCGNPIGCPGLSLWSLIVEHVPRSEMPKIHTILGRSLVDTYTELHAEAVMWHKIWQDSKQGGPLGYKEGGPLARPRGPLADPPVIKELVRAEVKMLLENLQEKFLREGRHDEEFLSRYNAKTVNFALGRLDISSNPKDEIRLSSRCSIQSHVEEEIEAVKDKLNIIDINKVVEHIKCILIEECAALKSHVEHIQEMIKKQCRRHGEDKEPEPTLADLKELRGAIQKDFELYPSPPSNVPDKALRKTFRFPSEQKSADKTSQALTATSIRRPHPPSAPPRLTHLNYCGSLKPINTLDAISRTSRQHKSQADVCTRTSRHRKVCLKTPAGDQVAGEPEEDESDLHWRFLTCSGSSPFIPSQYLQPG